MDIDIDLPTNFEAEKIFNNGIRASVVKNKKLTKHQAGIYFQNIPIDRISGLSAIPYDKAEEFGYFKVDFLHLSILDVFKSKNQIRDLIKIEPDWNLLESKEYVEKLFQLNNHFKLIQKIKPRSVQEIADCIALSKPGKKHLIDEYINNREFVRDNLLYIKTKDGYYIKKSHAVSYALTVVLNLHIIKAELMR